MGMLLYSWNKPFKPGALHPGRSKEVKVKWFLVHKEGIKRGPYISYYSAKKSCVFASGYKYDEAKKRGWKIIKGVKS
jgi:hypothetical protein